MLDLKGLKSVLLDLPTPSNLNWGYKLGSMLGLVYMIQIFTGLILSLVYKVGDQGGYFSVIYIMMDLDGGWVIRLMHSVGSSLLFLLLYLHIVRGVVYSGVKMSKVWLSGVVILMICMGVSFLGYVLPWGQMSYWGMTVVTSMMGAIPLVGDLVVGVLWGSSVAGVLSLVRFYSLHYLLSLVMGVLVLVHLVVLHEKGSSNPLGVFSSSDKIMFHPSYSFKDFLGVVSLLCCYWMGLFILAYSMLDETNFEEVNFLSTPEHIKPEWYFLFAYCILRSVSNKLGGVVLMFSAIGVLILFSLTFSVKSGSGCWSVLFKIWVVLLIISFILLILLGGLEVSYPFDLLSKIMTSLYFISVFFLSFISVFLNN